MTTFLKDFSGFIAVVKQDCPTCVLIESVFADLESTYPIRIYSQDSLNFPSTVKTVMDDTGLEASYRLDIEIVPTLIQVENGEEIARLIGWKRDDWRTLTGIDMLGKTLLEFSPWLWLEVG